MYMIFFNCFMFVFTSLNLPGTNDMYGGALTFVWAFGVGAVVGFIGALALVAIANYSSLPLPNERSITYFTYLPLVGGTLLSFLPSINSLLMNIGLNSLGAMLMVDIISIGVGLAFFWTLLQWVLGGGESIA